MFTKDTKIFVASVSNVTKVLKFYGEANLSNITLLKLIYKYVQFSTTNAQLQRLDQMVNYLQINDSNICVERLAGSTYIDGAITPQPITVGIVNVAPVINGFTFLVTELSRVFSNALFNASYVDTTPRGNIIIKTLPLTGTLKYNDELVVAGQSISDPGSLVYFRNGGEYLTSFTYSVLDTDSQIPLESNVATVSIDVQNIVLINQPATIGDKSINQGNRVTTIFTVADFSAVNTDPFYSDPESDLLNAIRIDEISLANLGTYYFYGVEVIQGQVITAQDLNAGAFYHEGADINASQTDVINVSVRDNGSLIWVS